MLVQRVRKQTGKIEAILHRMVDDSKLRFHPPKKSGNRHTRIIAAWKPTRQIESGLLQRAGLIPYLRGTVAIQDRPGLESTACECYPVVRDEFKRLKLL